MASASHVPAATETSEPQPSELERLERAVRALIEERSKLLHENESMREELEAMQGLQERLVEEAQLRLEALGRIDALVEWLEGCEPALARRAEDGTE
jgi:regulator of replication initiation timing